MWSSLRSAVVVLLCWLLIFLPVAVPAQTTTDNSLYSSGLFGTLTTFPKTPAQLEQYAFERALSKSLGESLPIKLDASSTYPTIENSALPGGPFTGIPISPTVENLAKPIQGDVTFHALAFCQEYSIHRPGAGTAYKIGPLQGKAAELIGTLLWRGVIAGKAPSELQAVEWAIEAGVPYAKMPKSYQNDIDQLIPNYKNQLQESWLERPEAAYREAVGNPVQAVKALGKIPGVGSLAGLMLRALPTPPPTLDGFLAKAGMGAAGRFYTESKTMQAQFQASDTNEELRKQRLYDGQGSQLPPQPAREGPWTVKADGVYMRFIVHGGNLQADNELQIRVLPQKTAAVQRPHLVDAVYTAQSAAGASSTTAQQVTLLSLMGLTLAGPRLATAGGAAGEVLEAGELIGVIASGAEIAFAVGVGAQALIIVLPIVAHAVSSNGSNGKDKVLPPPPITKPGAFSFTPPGDCTPQQYQQLNDEVDNKCKFSGPRACRGPITRPPPQSYCTDLGSRLDKNRDCLDARKNRENTCFRGGDDTHKRVIKEAQTTVDDCVDLIGQFCQ